MIRKRIANSWSDSNKNKIDWNFKIMPAYTDITEYFGKSSAHTYSLSFLVNNGQCTIDFIYFTVIFHLYLFDIQSIVWDFFDIAHFDICCSKSKRTHMNALCGAVRCTSTYMRLCVRAYVWVWIEGMAILCHTKAIRFRMNIQNITQRCEPSYTY